MEQLEWRSHRWVQQSLIGWWWIQVKTLESIVADCELLFYLACLWAVVERFLAMHALQVKQVVIINQCCSFICRRADGSVRFDCVRFVLNPGSSILHAEEATADNQIYAQVIMSLYMKKNRHHYYPSLKIPCILTILTQFLFLYLHITQEFYFYMSEML